VASPFINIIEQHAEEAAFLWLLHSQELGKPNPNQEHLAHLKQRIDAHVKGLILAGDEGWNCCVKALETHREAGEVFAASMLALHSADKAQLETVLQAVEAAPETAKVVIAALVWYSFETTKPIVDQLLASESPTRKKIGSAVYALSPERPRTSFR
jgi:uncharacterized protein (TIGR02270 family)